jgi:hypothetical protein
MNMLTKEKAKILHSNRKAKNEKTTHTPPVYPVVDIPVPDLDLNTMSGNHSPWYFRLLVYIVAKVLPE